jgi:hypothetical protein
MKNKTVFKTIEEYLFQENKTFVIPNYQRGYKWAVKEPNHSQTAVEVLLDDLLKANQEQQYFLQGVTVAEEGNNIILIDGQQRTTTLYLLLWRLSSDLIKIVNLEYDIREKSKEFINKLKEDSFDYANFDKDNQNQDIFYFKKAIEQIDAKIKDIQTNKEAFIKFLRTKVTILYIIIDKDKATKTFTMMNGSKASMLDEELVKAEMLRKISLPNIEEKKISSSIDENLSNLKEIIAKDWEINALRSRYAREWDKWLYWWNREDVKSYFATEKPMGLLLDFYASQKKQKFSFENFINLLVSNNGNEKEQTKQVFKELRDLQKSFEDIFSIPRVHNYLKLSLICASGNDDKFEIINYFMQKRNETKLDDDYAKWRLVGATHRQITELKEGEETKESKAEETLCKLSQKFVYGNDNDLAAKQLLRLNVEEDNKLFDGKGRKFDFSIYGNKSLEHIHPKSKVYHKEEIDKDGIKTTHYKDGNGNDLGKNPPSENEWLNRDEMIYKCNGKDKVYSEHSIGNLLLLDKNENSKFNDNPFDEKKKIYFDINDAFKSRNLLHTISVFANSTWAKDDIEKNQKAFISRFKKDYNIEDNNEK